MTKKWSDDEASFGELLRQEARAAMQPFSESLHERICRAARQFRADEASAALAIGGSKTRLGWASLAFAAVCLMVAAIAWQAQRAPHAPQIRAVAPAENELVSTPVRSLPGLADLAAVEAGRLIDRQLLATQLAYLEHDAGLLARMLTGTDPSSLIPTNHPTAEPQ